MLFRSDRWGGAAAVRLLLPNAPLPDLVLGILADVLCVFLWPRLSGVDVFALQIRGLGCSE